MALDIITYSKLKKKADLVNGKVPSEELPSYVDDVIEVQDYAHLPAIGESGKIYVTLDTNKTYRWSGSTYIEIGGGSLPAGTAGTAMVHNGYTWTAQSGYGYETPGTGGTVTWDGSIEGKDTFSIELMPEITLHFYKMADKPTSFSVTQIKYRMATEEEYQEYDVTDMGVTCESGTGASLYYAPETNSYIILADGGSFDIPDSGLSGNAPSPGMYFSKFTESSISLFYSFVSYGTQGIIQKIDSKFIPKDATLANAETNGGIGWIETPSNENTSSTSLKTITWDGDTTGRDAATIVNTYGGEEALLGTSYKVSDDTPSLSDLLGNTFTLYFGETEDLTMVATLDEIAPGKAYMGIMPEEFLGPVVSGDINKIYVGINEGFWVLVAQESGTLVLGDASSEEYGLTTITIPSAGIYFLKNEEGMYTSKISYNAIVPIVHKISSQFIDEDATLASAKTNAGIGWVTPGTGGTVTWDGVITGRDHSQIANSFNFYKVDNATPSQQDLSSGTFKVGSQTYSISSTTPMTINSDGVLYTQGSFAPLLVVLVDNASGFIQGSSYTFATKGIYFGKNGDDYTSQLVYGTPEVTHKISSDIVDDTNKTNKFVTSAEKTTWSGKQDTLVSGTNIKTINNQSLLASGNISIEGLPTSTTAGTAMVHNGTQWTQQTGYGYDIPGTGDTLNWDGNTEGKQSVGEFYYVTDTSIPQNYIVGSTVTILNGGAITTSPITATNDVSASMGQPSGTIITAYSPGTSFGYLVIYNTFTYEETTYTAGTWFQSISSTNYISKIVYGTQASVQKIDHKFIPEDEVLANAKTNAGIGWIDSGFITKSVTWDGEWIGRRETLVYVSYQGELEHTYPLYKVSNDLPSIANLVGQTLKITWEGGSEESYPLISTWSEVTSNNAYVGYIPYGSATTGDATKLWVILQDGYYSCIIATQSQTLVITDGSITYSIEVPEAGMYFWDFPGEGHTSYLSYKEPTTTYHKISSDLVDDTDKTNRFVTSTEKTTWNNKSTASVSATGTSTNDVRYITIDGTESRFSSVALKAMKNAWVTGTTAAAATAILNDDSVVAGDGFLATVYWTDLPGEITQAEVKAFVMKKGTSYQKIIQFECTSGTVAPYSWFYNSYEGKWRSQVPLNNTLTSTSVNEALTANMGRNLQDQISGKQATLVSGTNIKTVNGNSLLGSGDVTIATIDAEVVQTTGTSTANVMSQNAVSTEISTLKQNIKDGNTTYKVYFEIQSDNLLHMIGEEN